MRPHGSQSDARALEEAFFTKQNALLLEQLRAKARHEERRQALHEAAPNADDALLDHLIELGIGPETVLAIVLVPLAVVAWADGAIDARERAAILRAAAEHGIRPPSAAFVLLESWLGERPDPGMLDAWKRYVKTVWGAFDEEERRQMHERMIGLARGVAQAAGGFLGLGSKIAPPEQAVLDELDAALRV